MEEVAIAEEVVGDRGPEDSRGGAPGLGGEGVTATWGGRAGRGSVACGCGSSSDPIRTKREGVAVTLGTRRGSVAVFSKEKKINSHFSFKSGRCGEHGKCVLGLQPVGAAVSTLWARGMPKRRV